LTRVPRSYGSGGQSPPPPLPVVTPVASDFVVRKRLKHLITRPSPIEVSTNLVVALGRPKSPFINGPVEVIELDDGHISEKGRKFSRKCALARSASSVDADEQCSTTFHRNESRR
jgi:hypothetical protein